MDGFSFRHYDGPDLSSDNPFIKSAKSLLDNYGMLTEFYLRAWISETGYKPSDCEIVIEHTPTGSRTFVRKRENI